MTLLELMILCTTLAKKVYGAAYTKLIKKVKKLEKTIKSNQARRRAKIMVSDDEEDLEDSSKQGRMIEEIDQDAGVTLVTPTHSQEDQPEDQLGVFSAAKNSKTLMEVMLQCGGGAYGGKIIGTPKRVSKALCDPSWGSKAMPRNFLYSLKTTNCLSLVDLPKWSYREIVQKWVYRNKKDERGIVIKNKARLVAQGHTQEEGIDYDEVFAPVARIEAIRMFCFMLSYMGFHGPTQWMFLQDTHLLAVREFLDTVMRGKTTLGDFGFRTADSLALQKQTNSLPLTTTEAVDMTVASCCGQMKSRITATIDGHSKTITEASLRRHLKLDDHDNITSIPNSKIFEQLALMGYHTDSDKLTFQKGAFSPQWRFLIHTILHCLSPKKTAWEQFRVPFNCNRSHPHLPHAPKPSIKHSPDHTTAAVSFPSPTQPSPGAEQHIPTPNESPLHVVHSHGSAEAPRKSPKKELRTRKVEIAEALKLDCIEQKDEEPRAQISRSRRNADNGTQSKEGQRAMSEAKSSKKIDWNDPSVHKESCSKDETKQPIFEKVWDFNQHIEPMDLEHGSERMKSPEKIEEEDVDTQKEMKEVSKESRAKRKKSLPKQSQYSCS
ncbi:putative ribonuclease H-like domain-containing protein [Tanacetum coccineum]